MKKITLAFATSAIVLAGCSQPEPTGGRELDPPRTGIEVGSLYFVREKPRSDFDQAADLEDLCVLELSADQIAGLSTKTLPDFDILKELDADGALSGIKTKAVDVGLSANLEKYYSYKLTNVQSATISLVDAENLFDSQAFRSKCKGWRKNVDNLGFAAYQVLSVTMGDLEFARRSGVGADAEVSAKLAELEPELKAELKRTYSSTLSGKGLVVSFKPLPRGTKG